MEKKTILKLVAVLVSVTIVVLVILLPEAPKISEVQVDENANTNQYQIFFENEMNRPELVSHNLMMGYERSPLIFAEVRNTDLSVNLDGVDLKALFFDACNSSLVIGEIEAYTLDDLVKPGDTTICIVQTNMHKFNFSDYRLQITGYTGTDEPIYSVKVKNISEDITNYCYTVSGTLVNEQDKALDVEVTAVFYDKDGKIIGIGEDWILGYLYPDEEQGFTINLYGNSETISVISSYKLRATGTEV